VADDIVGLGRGDGGGV